MPKPTVRYVPNLSHDFIEVGKAACVFPVDHPSHLVSNKRTCITSAVVSHNPVTGEFETRNTLYIPVKEVSQVKNADSSPMSHM